MKKNLTLLFCLFLVLSNINAQSNECATATPLTIQSAANCPANATNVSSAQIAAATASAQTACYTMGEEDDDLWFSVTPTAAIGGIEITVAGAGGYDAVVQVFQGGCASTNAIGCVDAGIADDSEIANLITVPGTTYYIRVYNYDATVAGVSFSICVSNFTNALACPVEVTPASSAYCNAANPLLAWSASAGATDYNVFFGTTNPPAFIGSVTTTSISTLTNLAPNTTYFWTVVPESATGFGACFNAVQSFTTPGPPSNDACASATAIGAPGGVGSVASCNELATQSNAPINCAGTSSSAPDVWFSFTTDSDGGNAAIAVTGVSAGFDPVVEVLSSCAGGNLGCADAGAAGAGETVNLTALAANTTYYIRVYGWSGSMGNFTISTTGTALPMELLSFSAKSSKSDNIVEWKTAREQNTKIHLVQRSANGTDGWSNIGSVAAAGNSDLVKNYSFVDNKPMVSNFYRLKTIDIDSRESFSAIVSVTRKVEVYKVAQVYPNPTDNDLNINIEAPASDEVSLEISDILGKSVYTKQLELTEGMNSKVIDIANLPQGSYYLSITNSNGVRNTTKVIKN